MESSVPHHNTRIKLPTTQRDMVYDGKCSKWVPARQAGNPLGFICGGLPSFELP